MTALIGYVERHPFWMLAFLVVGFLGMVYVLAAFDTFQEEVEEMKTEDLLRAIARGLRRRGQNYDGQTETVDALYDVAKELESVADFTEQGFDLSGYENR